MKCTLCGETEFKIITNHLRHNITRNVVSCTKCSLTCLENPTEEDIDYESEYRKKHSPILDKELSPLEFYNLAKGIFQNRLEHIKPLLNPQFNILEIGCATGHFLDLIKDDVSKCVGLELNKEHAHFAKEHLNLEVYDKSLSDVDFPTQSFDVIFLFQVLEHIPDPISFLKLCRQYLKPTGKIYIEVPNIDDALLSIYKVPQFKEFYFRLPHRYYYSKETLDKIMQKAGFIGSSSTIQEYSVFNHIHWLLTGKPQDDLRKGYSPVPINLDIDQSDIKQILNDWFITKNLEYKKILEKNDVGEHIRYLGELK